MPRLATGWLVEPEGCIHAVFASTQVVHHLIQKTDWSFGEIHCLRPDNLQRGKLMGAIQAIFSGLVNGCGV
jgi:hypothetical protein